MTRDPASMHRSPGTRRRPALTVVAGLVLSAAFGIPAPTRGAPSSSTNVVPSATVTSSRVAGADRYGTAVAVSKRLFPTGTPPVVYLASGEGFPDALAAGRPRRMPRGSSS